jgi:hypothetical protein
MESNNQLSNKYARLIGLALLLMVTGLSLSRCYYDSKEELYPSISNNCDITNISYASGVQPILQENCLGCHGSSYNSSGGGVDLRSYSAVKANIDAVLGSINHSNGYSAMPKGTSKLKDCQITIIQSWKDNGFPQ